LGGDEFVKEERIQKKKRRRRLLWL